MACSSDKGTIHIFSLSKTKGKVATDDIEDEKKQEDTKGSEAKNKSHK